MNDESATAGFAHGTHKIAHKPVTLMPVDANAVLDCDRHTHHIHHRLDAIGHQGGLGHQARTKRAALHPLGRAAAVQIDFVITPMLAQPGALGEIGRLAAAKLQRHRMLLGIEIEVTRHIAIK